MNVLISGASGFIGLAASRFLSARGDQVVSLSRSRVAPGRNAAHWNPDAGTVDLTKAGTLDAVIHLAGESIVRRWTPARRAAIYDSRVRGTQLICRALTALPDPPQVVICASAIGYYGDRGSELLDESSAPGNGFLANLCREWEAAAEPARQAGMRVVHLRFGIVLAAHGGALAKMLPVFQLGLGGPLGDGKHWCSWITLDDVLRVIAYTLSQEQLSGPINAVAPNPVTNREFTKTLGAVLRRPTILAVPSVGVKLLFGEMADEALLASARVCPARLREARFVFEQPTLEVALRHVLGKT